MPVGHQFAVGWTTRELTARWPLRNDIVSSSNVRISDSMIVTADDAIVIMTVAGRTGQAGGERHGHQPHPHVLFHTHDDRHRDAGQYPKALRYVFTRDSARSRSRRSFRLGTHFA